MKYYDLCLHRICWLFLLHIQSVGNLNCTLSEAFPAQPNSHEREPPSTTTSLCHSIVASLGRETWWKIFMRATIQCTTRPFQTILRCKQSDLITFCVAHRWLVNIFLLTVIFWGAGWNSTNGICLAFCFSWQMVLCSLYYEPAGQTDVVINIASRRLLSWNWCVVFKIILQNFEHGVSHGWDTGFCIWNFLQM